MENNKLYNRTTYGSRQLYVPNAELKALQQTTHKRFAPYVEFKGTHAIIAEVDKQAREYKYVTRTDIAKCFETINHNAAIQAWTRWLDDKGLDALPTFKTLLVGERGIATGAPLSPLATQILFKSLDLSASTGECIYQYVDDILILHNTPEPVTIQKLKLDLSKMGWELSPQKTITGLTDNFSFLGVHFPREVGLDEVTLTPKDIGLPAYTEVFSLTNRDIPYTKELNNVRLSTANAVLALEKGNISALTAIGLLSIASGPDNPYQHTIASDVLPRYHSKIYKSYVSTVKEPREQGKAVSAYTSQKVLLELSMLTFIRENGRFPATCKEWKDSIKDFEGTIADSHVASHAYHTAIKDLFKREYAARVNNFSANILPLQELWEQKTQTHKIEQA